MSTTQFLVTPHSNNSTHTHTHTHLPFLSFILKVPFENSGGSGIVYIWIGSKATQEEAIHAEQMGRSMFEVGEWILLLTDPFQPYKL